MNMGLDHQHDDLPDTLDAVATQLQARTGAVCVWWQLTGFISVEGPDAISFLDGLTTQDLAGLPVGVARHALFLTTKARIIAPTIAYRASETCVLLELDPDLQESLLAHLKRYRLRAKLELQAAPLAVVSLVGPASEAWAGKPGWFDTAAAFGLPARSFVGDIDEASQIVAVEAPNAEIGLAEPESLDALRIELGVPALNDLLVDSMPAEVGAMELAVSLTKGCYLGQEPVARLHYRGKANRGLRQVRLSAEVPDDYFADREPGSDGYLALARASTDGQAGSGGGGGGRSVGTLTSWAHTPAGELVGLAILRREIEDGELLQLEGAAVTVLAGLQAAAPLGGSS